MIYKIGIIGCGVVGGSILKYFSEKNNLHVKGYDKYKKIGSFEDILNSDIIFLCLPSLFKEDKYDLQEIDNVCKLLSENNYQNILILKSTVTPETTSKLNEKYGLNIIHNPEFLSQKTCYEDFKNQEHIVLGGENKNDLEYCETFFKTIFPKANYSILKSMESELMKISVNNFYSVKIMFFNEIYLLCQKLDISYEKVKDTMLKNNWINPMHTTVPGTDGKLGFGGMCFPKDTNAFYHYLKNNVEHFKVIESVVEENKLIRY
jgi:UDPglucose 6-dehydrogenase